MEGSRGAGFGTPQLRIQGVVARASDNGSFVASCQNSAAVEPFVATVRYQFEVSPEQDVWEPVGPPFACSASSVGTGGAHSTVLAVPGTPGCPDPRIVFAEDDPLIGLPHRLCIAVLRASGCTTSWTHGEAEQGRPTG